MVSDGVSTLRPSMPVQLDLFSGEPDTAACILPDGLFKEDGAAWSPSPSIHYAASSDNSSIVVSGYGVSLSKKSERVVFKENGKAVCEVPFFRISEISIQSRGVSVSSDVIEELCLRGIRLNFLSFSGKPYAVITSPFLSATVQTRRKQLAAFSDERGGTLSVKIVSGKIRNQYRLLKYASKNFSLDDSDRLAKITKACADLEAIAEMVSSVSPVQVDVLRNVLLGYEGSAARIYWDAFGTLISGRQEFFGREYRVSHDIVNSLLNYGYGMLYAQVWGAAMNAGLEPFAGYLHVDRPGKPSLILDMVEEFRAPVIDRVVIAFINRGEDFTLEHGLLPARIRKRFSEKVLERFEACEPYRGKKYQLKSIIQMQARRLASWLNGSGDYAAFAFKW